MYRTMMSGKLHRATVTEANLNYVGSITIDEDLIDAVGMLPNEKVQIVNNNNGARLETYIIPGKRGSGVICLNGAAARLVQEGDKVIIISYKMMSDQEAASHEPKVAVLNDQNKIEQMLGTNQPVQFCRRKAPLSGVFFKILRVKRFCRSISVQNVLHFCRMQELRCPF